MSVSACLSVSVSVPVLVSVFVSMSVSELPYYVSIAILALIVAEAVVFAQVETVRETHTVLFSLLTLSDQCSHSPCSFTRYSNIVSWSVAGGSLRSLAFPSNHSSI